jgi:hypothetical protein
MALKSKVRQLVYSAKNWIFIISCYDKIFVLMQIFELALLNNFACRTKGLELLLEALVDVLV